MSIFVYGQQYLQIFNGLVGVNILLDSLKPNFRCKINNDPHILKLYRIYKKQLWNYMKLTFLQNQPYHQDIPTYNQTISMEQIRGYKFDLTNKIYLNHLKSKFWEVFIENADVTYRAGVLRGSQEHKIKEVTKNYQSNSLAKATVITKIALKIQKGYYSTKAQRLELPVQQKKTVKRKKKNEKQDETEDAQQVTKQTKKKQSKKRQKPQSAPQAASQINNNKFWKGMQKGEQIVQFEVIGNQLKVTQKSGDSIRSQIKNFASFDESIDYVYKQEEYYSKQGFEPMKSSAFLEQEYQSISSTTASKKKDKGLTSMTDNAMWINSGLINQDSGENVYQPNIHLGPPIDHCIKCLLAENYKEESDPTGWIMSQKLDGVRCLWTGNQMYSRNGNKFNFPNFFTKNWPNSQLDGQLFIGRGKFSQTISAVKKNIPIATQWANLKYLVFDAPGLREPFKQRIKTLERELGKIDNAFIKCHAHRPCQGFPDLFTELQKVNKAGGQGIMLRQPSAFYQNKRSKNLQKVKTFYDDEAQVIGYTPGTGRCLGWVGALRVRNGKKIEFEVGSGLNDQLRQNPPPLGSKITYKYQQFNKDSGKPRFPTFLRMHVAL